MFPGLIGLLFKVLAVGSVLTLIFCEALRISSSDFKLLDQYRGLFVRSLASVLVIAPLAVFLLVLILRPDRPVAIGLALFAASPAAPLIMVRMSTISEKRGLAAALHLSTAVLSIVTVPLALFLFSKGLHFTATIGSIHVAALVAKLILLPMTLGLLVNFEFPRFAKRLLGPLSRIGRSVLLLALALLLFKTYRFFGNLSFRCYFSMATAVLVSLLIGHWMAGRVSATEKSVLALECAGRHPGIVLMIVALNAPQADALPIVVPYLCVFLVVSAIYINRAKLFPWGTRTPSEERFHV
jgi:BASS family bile acid:Na+ symporter